jgi:ribosome-interacting GTPase 1
MPTNLPPDYFEIEKRFREAESAAEKVSLLEQMYSVVPKHKGTDHLRADLRKQMSKLKGEAQEHKKRSGHPSSYQIEREGAGQVALIGPTNTGKSALLAALTNARPEVSPAPYTTWGPTPGMLQVENIQVQLIDTPPINPEFVEGGLFDLLRHCDLILLVVDLQGDPLEQVELTLAQLREHRIAPDGFQARYADQERMTYVPLLVLANKCDDESQDELFEVCCELFEGEGECPLMPISAVTGRNFDLLKRRIFEAMDVIRVYARPPGREPDLERPFVLKRGSTVADLARKVHRDFYDKLKTARVWGSTAFEGQMVQRDYVLQDGDIIELRI